jgi:hypothetical protein
MCHVSETLLARRMESAHLHWWLLVVTPDAVQPSALQDLQKRD